ncbi:MAG: GNAT family N-acetyltransferase, partial [Bacteroidota bacterium]
MTHYWQNDLVRLRSLEPEDWQFFYDWNLETEDQMKMDTLWFPTSTQHVKRWIEKQLAETISREEWYFVIETLAGETVGMINTRDCKVHDRRFSYGVGVRQAFRGKGYAKAAIQLVLAYYFRHKGYQRVEVEVY